MAARDLRMDSWINRCRSFAEGVVVMVSPVLLAFALTKVNLEHGRVLPIIMLVVAGFTLVAGICPFLAFSFSNFRRDPNNQMMPRPPHVMTKWLVPICSACLVGLACWIMSLIIYNNKAIYSVPGALIALCIIIRKVQYWLRDDANNQQQQDEEYYTRLENSLECLAGTTAFLFVGLEGLALESYVSGRKEAQQRLTAPMATSFCACVVGVFAMFLATIPPCRFSSIGILAAALDVVVGVAVSLVMFFMMHALVELRALLVMAPGFLILLAYVLYVAMDAGSGGNNLGGEHEPPASLELTKVTFVGFLAVSIPSISNGSVNWCTEWFIHLAAAAIVSGLMWRLLTHLKSDEKVKAAVSFASICTHFCIAIAVIPFTIMAGKALP